MTVTRPETIGLDGRIAYVGEDDEWHDPFNGWMRGDRCPAVYESDPVVRCMRPAGRHNQHRWTSLWGGDVTIRWTSADASGTVPEP